MHKYSSEKRYKKIVSICPFSIEWIRLILYSSDVSGSGETKKRSYRRSSTIDTLSPKEGIDGSHHIEYRSTEKHANISAPSVYSENEEEPHSPGAIAAAYHAGQTDYPSILGSNHEGGGSFGNTRECFPNDFPYPGHLMDYPTQTKEGSAMTSMRSAIILPDLLTITEQPNPFGRFRYKSEKRERPLEGEKTYPEITVNPNYISNLPPNCQISVSLVTRSGRPHWHELSGTTSMAIDPSNPRIRFENLSVVMNKLREVDVDGNKEDLRAVRLRFSLEFEHLGQMYYGECTSHPIYNGKLVINKLSSFCGPVTGGQELILLCSKIRKASTALRLTEDLPNMNFYGPSQINVGQGLYWTRDFKSGRFTLNVPSTHLSFHHQYVIIFETPSYYDINITRQVRINIQIIDVEDHTESQETCYFYIPVEHRRRPPSSRPHNIGMEH
jgi:hypothetical protein